MVYESYQHIHIMDKDNMQQVKFLWLIDALLNIKSLEGHSQEEIAKEINVSPQFISKVKNGKAPVPDSLVWAINKRYSIPTPFVETPPTEKTAHLLQEDKSNYQPTVDRIIKLLEQNNNDLRRELTETYDHISDLKTFNVFLRDIIQGKSSVKLAL